MIPDHGRDITDEYSIKVPRLYNHQVEMLKRLSAIGQMPDCPVDLGKSGFVLESSVKGKSQW